MIYSEGWSSLLWCPLGYYIGCFVYDQMIPPIILGFPIAISLIIKNKMQASVLFALFFSSAIWFVLIGIIGFCFPSLARWATNNNAFSLGNSLSFFVVLTMPLFVIDRFNYRRFFNYNFEKFYK
jgi:hypothetical protein